jgi:hypothetical protein
MQFRFERFQVRRRSRHHRHANLPELGRPIQAAGMRSQDAIDAALHRWFSISGREYIKRQSRNDAKGSYMSAQCEKFLIEQSRKFLFWGSEPMKVGGKTGAIGIERKGTGSAEGFA